jgi:hypothetical protein
MAAAIDASRLGGPMKQAKHSKKTKRAKLIAHQPLKESIRSSITEVPTCVASAIRSLGLSPLPTMDYINLGAVPLSQVKKPPVIQVKEVEEVVAPQHSDVQDKSLPYIQQGFIEHILSGKPSSAKKYLQYATQTQQDDVERHRETIRIAEQDFVRPMLEELKARCLAIEPTPYVGDKPVTKAIRHEQWWQQHNGEEVYHVSSKKCENWLSKDGDLHWAGMKTLQYRQLKPVNYVKWLEHHYPIQRRDGTPLATVLKGRTKVMMLTEKEPVYVGSLMVGKTRVTRQIKVVDSVSGNVKRKAIARRQHSVESRNRHDITHEGILGIGTVYSHKNVIDLASHNIQFDKLVTEQRATADQEYKQHNVKKAKGFAHYANLYTYSSYVTPNNSAVVEEQQEEVAPWDADPSLYDVASTTWDVNIPVADTHSEMVELRPHRSEEQDVLEQFKLSYYDAVQQKLYDQDHLVFCHKFAVARRMQAVRENSYELGRYYCWLQDRELANSVQTDAQRYQEYWDKAEKQDPYGAIAVALLTLEKRWPSKPRPEELAYRSQRNAWTKKIKEDAKRYYEDIVSDHRLDVDLLHQFNSLHDIGEGPPAPKMPQHTVTRSESLLTTEDDTTLFKRVLQGVSMEDTKIHRDMVAVLKQPVVNLNKVRGLLKHFKEAPSGLLVPT